MPVVPGAILAGGPSTRFGGRPKGLERVGGVRIIDRVADALRAVVTDLIIVANDPAAASWIDGVRAVSDVDEGRASLLGIHAALAHSGGHVVVVAWDMPFVPASLLGAITARLTPDISAVIPEGPDGPEPCCALYTSSALAHVERLVAAGELRLGETGRRPSRTRCTADRSKRCGELATPT